MCASSTHGTISGILLEMASIAFESQNDSLVVLDGLDECRPGEAEKTLAWFTSRQKETSGNAQGRIRLLCIGQRVYPLQSSLQSAATITMENDLHRKDIELYVRHRASRIRQDFELNLDIESDIISRTTIIAKSKHTRLSYWSQREVC
jgi:hypothetical protein